jgi:DNA-binding response OmpR family regulator
MPVMTGEVFARILSSLGTPPPVLVVSGEPEGEQIARQLGAAGYLAKPFNLQALLGAVQSLLGGAQAKPRTSLEW